jgi:D-3-phosphoglycerate dehydrogenase
MLKVVNTIAIPDVDFGEHLLASLNAQLVQIPAKSEDDLIAAAAGADAVIGSGPVQPWSARVIEALDRCRIIASLGVGYDRIDLTAATSRSVVVTNVPDYCIDEVASHTIALMLAQIRKLIPLDREVRSAPVTFVPPNRPAVTGRLAPITRLRDQWLGIIGLGRIGRVTALKAKGLGMAVMAHDPHVSADVMAGFGVRAVDLETLLADSDCVCINASLTDASRGMIDAAALRRMKPTAYLVNTARGEIVNEPDLIRALEAGWIAGAGLDVTANDPVPVDDPLLTAPNMILTGHSAWYASASDSGPGFWHRAMAQVVRALDGHWPAYAVNGEVRQAWLDRWGRGGSR